MSEHSKLSWSIFEDKDGFEIITDKAEVYDGARWSNSDPDDDDEGHVAYLSKLSNKNAEEDAKLIVDSVNKVKRMEKAFEQVKRMGYLDYADETTRCIVNNALKADNQ